MCQPAAFTDSRMVWRSWTTGAALFVLSCSHVLATRTSSQEAAKSATIEDFIAENFTIGVQSFADSLPTGKPKRVIEHGFVRYFEPICDGDLGHASKPRDDLKTFCTARGGTFSAAPIASWGHSSLVNAGLVGSYSCSAGGTTLWRACIRLECSEPDRSCLKETFLIQGKSAVPVAKEAPPPICSPSAVWRPVCEKPGTEFNRVAP